MASNEITQVQGDAEVNGLISTLSGDDMETRRRVFKAVTGAEALSDHVGETILVEHIVQQGVTTQETDEVTGEVVLNHFIRTVLIGPAGKPSYAAASKGIANSVETIIQVLGNPARWDEPEAFVVKELGKKPRAFLTLELA